MKKKKKNLGWEGQERESCAGDLFTWVKTKHTVITVDISEKADY